MSARWGGANERSGREGARDCAILQTESTDCLIKAKQYGSNTKHFRDAVTSLVAEFGLAAKIEKIDKRDK